MSISNTTPIVELDSFSELPPLLTLEETAKYLGVSLATIRRRVDSGACRAVDISNPASRRAMFRVPREVVISQLRPFVPNARTNVDDVEDAVERIVNLAPAFNAGQINRISAALQNVEVA